jgi:hypothetical protein
MAQQGEGSGARGGGGAGDATRSGNEFVCCARRGCGKDGEKRCGGCKQVTQGLHLHRLPYALCDHSRGNEECGALPSIAIG